MTGKYNNSNYISIKTTEKMQALHEEKVYKINNFL